MHKNAHILPVKYLGIFILIILFCATGFSGFSQETIKDTIQVKKDSVQVKKPLNTHSPRKATIYSAVLPGLGQIYNRKYWKVPIVYGGFAALGYFINFNNTEYVKYRQAYSDIIDNDPTTNSFKKLTANPLNYEGSNLTQFTDKVKGYKDYWRRNRDLCVIGTAVFYAVNILDASVDANFFNFDIGDDLTINWAPAPDMCMNNRSIGLHCRITF
ncbi:MAG TPA: hypothetical protein DCL77_01105 [Prolixibacteraceae bacterium]|jgi:hypothetical protein|nr:hypothetical protein [Prolixibacteraceae bacterium]